VLIFSNIDTLFFFKILSSATVMPQKPHRNFAPAKQPKEVRTFRGRAKVIFF